MYLSDAKRHALGLDGLDHLVAQLLDVQLDSVLGLDPVLDAVLALEQLSEDLLFFPHAFSLPQLKFLYIEIYFL